jgi:molybdopterin molybdotransferase
MISVTDAQESIRRRAHPLAPETVTLAEAHGRILREPVRAPEDMPPFDRSAMDGYVVCTDDPAKKWRVIGEIRAGQISDLNPGHGEAVRIFTGAQLPGPGLRVIKQEDIEKRPAQIQLIRPVEGSHVRLQGEDARMGDVLLAPGTHLNAAAISLLASVGKMSLLVSPRPKILHLTTGDEIVPPEQPLARGQIRNSNASLISALAREWGANTTHFHAPDDLRAMTDLLKKEEPKNWDMILISGGSGTGKYDFTPELFLALQTEIHFRQVDVRPGKPLIFGSSATGLVFGLPGNALSHFVCFHLFVRTALATLLDWKTPPPASAILPDEIADLANSRETWWPVRTTYSEGRVEVRPLPWKSSGDITRLPAADALIRIPANTAKLPDGAVVDYLSLRPES